MVRTGSDTDHVAHSVERRTQRPVKPCQNTQLENQISSNGHLGEEHRTEAVDRGSHRVRLAAGDLRAGEHHTGPVEDSPEAAVRSLAGEVHRIVGLAAGTRLAGEAVHNPVEEAVRSPAGEGRRSLAGEGLRSRQTAGCSSGLECRSWNRSRQE